MNGRGMGMFGFLDIRIGWLTLFKMRLGCIVIRGDGDETRELSSEGGFVSSRGVEELECTVPRKKIGGTSEFFFCC